jgi:hypothetical protein
VKSLELTPRSWRLTLSAAADTDLYEEQVRLKPDGQDTVFTGKGGRTHGRPIKQEGRLTRPSSHPTEQVGRLSTT